MVNTKLKWDYISIRDGPTSDKLEITEGIIQRISSPQEPHFGEYSNEKYREISVRLQNNETVVLRYREKIIEDYLLPFLRVNNIEELKNKIVKVFIEEAEYERGIISELEITANDLRKK